MLNGIAERLRNREGCFTNNIQIVLYAELRFQNIAVRCPGSVRVSITFENCILKELIETACKNI